MNTTFSNFDYKVIEDFPKNTYIRRAADVKKARLNKRHDRINRLIGGSIFMGILVGAPWIASLICDALV